MGDRVELRHGEVETAEVAGELPNAGVLFLNAAPASDEVNENGAPAARRARPGPLAIRRPPSLIPIHELGSSVPEPAGFLTPAVPLGLLVGRLLQSSAVDDLLSAKLPRDLVERLAVDRSGSRLDPAHHRILQATERLAGINVVRRDRTDLRGA